MRGVLEDLPVRQGWPFVMIPASMLLIASIWVLGCDRAPGDGMSEATSVVSSEEHAGRATEPTADPGGPRGLRDQQDERPTIVALGDSLTAGPGVPRDQSYPAHLQRRLNEAGYRYRVVNAGVSGDTSAGGLRRLEWVLKSRPELVILEFGANDGLRGLPLEQLRANLDEMIRRLRAAGATVVLTGMKLPLNYGEEYRTRFEAVYHELARRHDLPFVPFFLEGVGGQTRLNLDDGIHPTGEGYRLIADHLWPVLKPLLKHEGRAGPRDGHRVSRSADRRARAPHASAGRQDFLKNVS
ncbi:arylesterase [Candidatus Nitrospira bockiana]